MTKIKNFLNTILKIFTGSCFILMVILVCYQVLTRYLFHKPSSWSEEIVSFIFVWTSLLGASLVLGERNHMNIPILINKFNLKTKKMFLIFAELIAILFSIMVLIYGGMKIVSLSMAQQIASFKIALGYFYLIVPICGILNIFYSLFNIHDILNGNIKESED